MDILASMLAYLGCVAGIVGALVMSFVVLFSAPGPIRRHRQTRHRDGGKAERAPKRLIAASASRDQADRAEIADRRNRQTAAALPATAPASPSTPARSRRLHARNCAGWSRKSAPSAGPISRIRTLKPAFGLRRLSSRRLRVRALQISHRIVGELARIAFAALRHLDNALGDDFLRRALIAGRGELAARLLDFLPGGFEYRNQESRSFPARRPIGQEEELST